MDRVDPLGLDFGPGNGDGDIDVDKCKELCHKWAEALAKQGGFNAAKALQNCFEGSDRDPKYVPGSPLPPLPTIKPTVPKGAPLAYHQVVRQTPLGKIER
jgi:hypothetical protein